MFGAETHVSKVRRGTPAISCCYPHVCSGTLVRIWMIAKRTFHWALAGLLGATTLLAQQSSAPEQPLPFSHKKHLSFQLECKFCHTNPEPGNQMTLPVAQTCMGCHAAVAKDKPAIQQLAEFAKSGQPIPWKPVYSVPGFVYWSHRTHLDAGIKCEMCH